MKVLDRIEFWHNRASDTTFVWYPFVFLKPEPASRIGILHRMKMIVLFGSYYGLFAAMKRWIFSGEVSPSYATEAILWSLCFFSIWFNLVTAPLWNRRAVRLAAR